MTIGLLTETADYDTPGSWGAASAGWPEVAGDAAHEMYRHANKSQCIPYGSYVLISERGKYGATVSLIRVHSHYMETLKTSFAAIKL